jgi:hypothetical protein
VLWSKEPIHRLGEGPFVAQETVEAGNDLPVARVEVTGEHLHEVRLLPLDVDRELLIEVLLQRLADVGEPRFLGLLVGIRQRAQADGPCVGHEAGALRFVERREDRQRVGAVVTDVSFNGVGLDIDEDRERVLRVHDEPPFFKSRSISAIHGMVRRLA